MQQTSEQCKNKNWLDNKHNTTRGSISIISIWTTVGSWASGRGKACRCIWEAKTWNEELRSLQRSWHGWREHCTYCRFWVAFGRQCRSARAKMELTSSVFCKKGQSDQLPTRGRLRWWVLGDLSKFWKQVEPHWRIIKRVGGAAADTISNSVMNLVATIGEFSFDTAKAWPVVHRKNEK